MIRLRTRLKEWTDYDVAIYHVVVVLGVIEEEQDKGEFYSFRKYKWLSNSNNVYGNMAWDIIHMLVKTEVLLRDEDEMTIKWNEDFELPQGTI